MAGEVRSLWVSLKAKTALFESGMKRARKELSGFVNQIPGANLIVSRFSAVLSVAGAAGFAAWVKRSSEALDATAKFADSLGFAVEKYQAIAFAGDLAGVSTEQLQTALRTMTRSVDDAARGTGGAAEAFRRLGLSAVALKRLSPDEQVKAIADALAKVPDAATKAALAMDVFGSRNASIVNLLGGGRKEIVAAEADLKALGLTMSRLDIRKVEIANDAWTRFGAVVRGVGERFAVELSPYIKAAADAMREWALSAGGVGNLVSGAVERAIEGVGFLARAFSAVKVQALGVQVAVLGIASAIRDATAQAVTWAENYKNPFVPMELQTKPSDFGGAGMRQAAAQMDALLRDTVAQLNAAVADAGTRTLENQVKAWAKSVRENMDAQAKASMPTQPAVPVGQWNSTGDFQWTQEKDPESEKQTRLLEGILDSVRQARPAIMVR